MGASTNNILTDVGTGTFGISEAAGKFGNGGPLGSIFGTQGGLAGSGLPNPEQANLQPVTTVDQVQQSQLGANNSLASQQALLRALQAQNGLGAQNAAFSNQQALANALQSRANTPAMQETAWNNVQGLSNALNNANGVGVQQNAISQQQALNAQLQAANGVGVQQGAIQGLQNLAAQQGDTSGLYRNLAAGVGPNPAQAALNQATGQNVANQAALMAGQRGAGSNVGLLARQAAQQGAQTQQQAVGQSATLQAQQQLNALQGLVGAQQAQGATQGQIGGFGGNLANMQQAGVGQLASEGSNLTQQQQAANALQSSVANQAFQNQMAANQSAANQANALAGQQIGTTQAGVQGNLSNAGQQQQALGSLNQASVGSQGNVNNVYGAIAGQRAKNQGDLYGGLLQGAGPAAAFKGGYVKKMDDGGVVDSPDTTQSAAVAPVPGPQSQFGQFLKRWASGIQTNDDQGSKLNLGGQKLGSILGSRLAGAMMSKGGLASTGGHVAPKKLSQKADKKGDSYSNDKVPTMLSEGEIVLPRSVTMSRDPVGAAADFVTKILAKRKASR